MDGDDGATVLGVGTSSCSHADYRCDLPTYTRPDAMDKLMLVYWFDSTATSEPKPAKIKRVKID